MKTVYAEYNHARWIALCPNCLLQGIQSAMEVKPGDLFICGEEHPNLQATTLLPNPRMAGAFNPVPDVVLREETRRAAIEADEAFEVIFPADKAEIERTLRMRPRHARNWTPDTTIAELQDENTRNGVENA